MNTGDFMAENLATQLQGGGADFVLFSTMTCPFCSAAKKALKQHGWSWKEHDVNVSRTMGLYSRVVTQTGHRTVPVVFDMRGDEPTFIGGSGELNSLLKRESGHTSPGRGLFGFLFRANT
jgi:glutaredoxin